MAHKLQVLFLQLPVPNNPALNTPLAAGYLKAYASAQGLDATVAIELLPRHLADAAGDALLVEELVARAPDVLAVSLYTWNSERSLAIARRVKERLPHLLVVAGGPEVQPDNAWLLRHPALDIGVIGEGEQTFVELLQRLCETGRPGGRETGFPLACSVSLSPHLLISLSGIVFRHAGDLVFTPPRPVLPDLAVIPSPYLAGHLELPEDGMLMVEVSRWCPYACSFCLYGRNLGPRLGSRSFSLERILAEIAWGRARGIRRVHFVEANLNLVPLFWPLMRALADLNADHQLTFYAELRGEHITDAVADALDRANVRYVEVGLQTANPAALAASRRRTDLWQWAAGTRRLYERRIEVFLDVILGLPADDEPGIAATLDFLRREHLGPYDVFTLQVLPGTAVRQQAGQYGLRFQERPPYYVLATDRLAYADLRRLRHELKAGAGYDPDGVEGLPSPRRDALAPHSERRIVDHKNKQLPISRLWTTGADMDTDHLRSPNLPSLISSHVDIIASWPLTPSHNLQSAIRNLQSLNPTTLLDIYLRCAAPPDPRELAAWRDSLPYQPGYLDRVAVYRRVAPAPEHWRVSPRVWLLLSWTAQAAPEDYPPWAQIIWRYDLADGEEPPLGAWRAAGGAGIWAPGASPEQAAAWEQSSGIFIWR